jgi:hypothetical protein
MSCDQWWSGRCIKTLFSANFLTFERYVTKLRGTFVLFPISTHPTPHVSISFFNPCYHLIVSHHNITSCYQPILSTNVTVSLQAIVPCIPMLSVSFHVIILVITPSYHYHPFPMWSSHVIISYNILRLSSQVIPQVIIFFIRCYHPKLYFPYNLFIIPFCHSKLFPHFIIPYYSACYHHMLPYHVIIPCYPPPTLLSFCLKFKDSNSIV